MIARLSEGEHVKVPTMKAKDAAAALYFIRFPLEGMNDEGKKDTIREMFLNYRPAFEKARRQYPALAAQSLKELMADDPYGYVSNDVKCFADSIPDYTSLERKIKTYKSAIMASGLGLIAYLNFMPQNHLTALSSFFAFLILYGFASGKISNYTPQYLFKKEFEEGKAR